MPNLVTLTSHLLPGFFQLAYVTTDLSKAIEQFSHTFGIRKFHQMREIPYDEHSHISIATAYVGETMIEIIQPHGPSKTIYDSVLPSDGRFAVRLHHLGNLMTDLSEYQTVVSQAKASHKVIYEGGMEGVIQAVYVDTYDLLGHYLEYIYCTPAGLDFLNLAPRN